MATTPRPSSAIRAHSQQPEWRHQQLLTPRSEIYLSPSYDRYRATSVPGHFWDVSAGGSSTERLHCTQFQLLSPETTPSSFQPCATYCVDETYPALSRIFTYPPPTSAVDDQSTRYVHDELTTDYWRPENGNGCGRVRDQQDQRIWAIQDHQRCLSYLNQTHDSLLDTNIDSRDVSIPRAQYPQVAQPMTPYASPPMSKTALEGSAATLYTPDTICSDGVKHSPSLLSSLKLEPMTPPVQQQDSFGVPHYPPTEDAKEDCQVGRRQWTDSSDTDFVCKLCDRGFVRQYNLNQHMKNLHAQDRPREYGCDDVTCGMRFRRPHDLQRHVDAVHRKSKIFECRKCRKGFPRKDSLQRHSRSNCLNKRLASKPSPKQGNVKIEHTSQREDTKRHRQATILPTVERPQSYTSDGSSFCLEECGPDLEAVAVPVCYLPSDSSVIDYSTAQYADLPTSSLETYTYDPMVDWNNILYMP